MANFKILEDFIPTSMSDALEMRVMWEDFKYQPSTIEANSEQDKKDPNIKESLQFVKGITIQNHVDGSIGHMDPLYDEFCKPILWFLEKSTGIKITDIFRIKINLLLPNDTNENNYSPPHVDDQRENLVSMVYYINDADGDTFIFDKDWRHSPYNLKVSGRSTPKKGNAVMFRSGQWHASSNPIDSPIRLIINFVFQVEPESFERFMNE